MEGGERHEKKERRVLAEGEGFYHVVSRIIGKRFWISDEEKRILLDVIRRAAAFSGVEVYTYALMSNHFHLLVRVPEKREVGDGELVERLKALYGKKHVDAILHAWKSWEKKGEGWKTEADKARFRARMNDLSQFVKTFKAIFSIGYNKRHKNTGSPWEGRFKSVLVEGTAESMMAVAGYIHLNPVRAGMAAEAERAEHAGYGAACRGDPAAQLGLAGLVGRLQGRRVGWREARAACGGAIEGKGKSGKRGGAFPVRVPGFSAGGALGSAPFAARVAAQGGPKKRTAPPPRGEAGVGAYGLASAFEVRCRRGR